MSKTYRVAVVGCDPNARLRLRELLIRLGHHVVAEVDSLKTLVQETAANGAELVICDAEPGDTTNALNDPTCRLNDIPVIIATNEVDIELLEREVAHQIFGVLLKPLREEELAVTIVVAAQRFHDVSELRNEACTLRAALEDRKVIEQAKGLIMKRCGLDETHAFRHLQHLARQHRQKIVEVAKGILFAETAFVPIHSDSKASLSIVQDNTVV
jgi:two-component system, response regulator PdtaR